MTAATTAVAAAGFAHSAAADALDNWKPCNIVNENAYSTSGTAISGLAYGNGLYLMVGYPVYNDPGFAQTSTDGVNWHKSADYNSAGLVDPYGVTFGNGVFVAVGWDGFGGHNLWNTTDGTNWTSHYSGIANVFGVIYGGGQFVAVGDGSLIYPGTGYTNRNIFTSTDGTNWTARSSGSAANDVQTIRYVAYGAGQYVAVDGASHIYNSSTGATWTKHTNNLSRSPVSFCNGMFIIPSGAGTNLVSSNGLTWTVLTNNTGATFGSVIYAAGTFVASTGSSNFFTSQDATNWARRNAPAVPGAYPGFGVGFANRNFYLLGSSQISNTNTPFLFLSDPVVAASMSNSHPPQVSVSGVVGASYRIDFITDPRSNNWQTATTLSLTNSPSTWTDPQATNSARYYRAVLLQ